MKRITLCLMITMVLSSVAFADDRTVALEYERKLDKHVTLNLRAATLKEVLAEVEKATGMHLLVQREIAEDKATVFVKDQPAQDVLRALAHCFNLGWSASPSTAAKPYLKLWMDRDYLALMQKREYQDYLSITDQFDKELNDTAKFIRAGTQFTASRAEIDKLSGSDKALWVRLYKRMEITANTSRGAMVLQFLALSKKQKEGLYAGNHVTVSGAEICADALNRWSDAKSFDYAIDRIGSGCLLRCAGRPGKGTYSISTAYFDNSAYAKEAELGAKQILADPALDKDLPAADPNASAANSIHPGEGSAAVLATMSDGLLDMARRTDIPIVAQYVSEYSGASTDWDKGAVSYPASTAKKIGGRFAELGKQHTFVVVRSGKSLLGKSLLWHRQRTREVPEAKIREWQKEFGGLMFPTFDGCVSIAAQPWGQVRGFIDNCGFWVGRQWSVPLARCSYALKLFGTLTADQKQWVSSGHELPGTALTPDQQAIWMSAFEVRESPTYESATDRQWPSKAAFSLGDDGFDDTMLFAVAKMLPVDKVSAEEGAVKVPEGTPQGDIRKIVEKQIGDLVPSLKAKLLATVAKDHPEIAAKDVSVYSLRHCTFYLKLGDETRQCVLIYAAKVK